MILKNNFLTSTEEATTEYRIRRNKKLIKNCSEVTCCSERPYNQPRLRETHESWTENGLFRSLCHPLWRLCSSGKQNTWLFTCAFFEHCKNYHSRSPCCPSCPPRWWSGSSPCRRSPSSANQRWVSALSTNHSSPCSAPSWPSCPAPPRPAPCSGSDPPPPAETRAGT